MAAHDLRVDFFRVSRAKLLAYCDKLRSPPILAWDVTKTTVELIWRWTTKVPATSNLYEIYPPRPGDSTLLEDEVPHDLLFAGENRRLCVTTHHRSVGYSERTLLGSQIS
jgi:hypothetical protein